MRQCNRPCAYRTRERLAGFKTPKRVVFHELPKTSTGKVQKVQLRDAAEAM